MQSAAHVFGSETAGIVLTGMGKDGTAGLASIRSVGGETWAQEPVSSIASGMPQSAIQSGVVMTVATPSGIGKALSPRVSPSTGHEMEVHI